MALAYGYGNLDSRDAATSTFAGGPRTPRMSHFGNTSSTGATNWQVHAMSSMSSFGSARRNLKETAQHKETLGKASFDDLIVQLKYTHDAEIDGLSRQLRSLKVRKALEDKHASLQHHQGGARSSFQADEASDEREGKLDLETNDALTGVSQVPSTISAPPPQPLRRSRRVNTGGSKSSAEEADHWTALGLGTSHRVAEDSSLPPLLGTAHRVAEDSTLAAAEALQMPVPESVQKHLSSTKHAPPKKTLLGQGSGVSQEISQPEAESALEVYMTISGFEGENKVASFQAWPVWNEPSPLNDGAQKGSVTCHNQSGQIAPRPVLAQTKTQDYISEGYSEIGDEGGSMLAQFILYPGSTTRLLWDTFGVALLTNDIIATPLEIFQRREVLFFTTMAYFSACYWTLDIVLTFLTGYHHKGTTVTKPQMIARRYISTYLLSDLVLTSADWITISLSDMTSSGWIIIPKVLRIMRLARIFKLRRFSVELPYVLTSQTASLVVDLIRSLLELLILNHIIACAWLYLGTSLAGDSDKTWLTIHGMVDESLAYRYSTALHWSLTQFTPASMNVGPENSQERFFTIGVISFALVVFSSFVSRITTSMATMYNNGKDFADQLWLLRRYLHERDVPKDISLRVQHYVQYQMYQAEHQIQEGRLQILSLLSQQLTCELQLAVYLPHLSLHPFFVYIHKSSDVTIHRLIDTSLHMQNYAHGDPIFFQGELAIFMSIISRGSLQYLRTLSNIPKRHLTEEVDQGTWLCEAVVWCPWVHPGELHAREVSELVMLQFEHFGRAMATNPAMRDWCRAYSGKYLWWLNQQSVDSLSDVPTEEEQEMVRDAAGWSNRRNAHLLERLSPLFDRRSRASLISRMTGRSSKTSVFSTSKASVVSSENWASLHAAQSDLTGNTANGRFSRGCS